jgi:hypothetical protein
LQDRHEKGSVDVSFAVKLRSLSVITAFLLLVGCADTSTKPVPAKNSVTGTVKMNDKLINYGAVAFIDANGKQMKVTILPDGSYTIRNPPQGEVKVIVLTGAPPIPASSPDGGKGGPLKFEKIDIPDHYSDPDKTDLRFTAKPGEHRFDIVLKPAPPSETKDESNSKPKSDRKDEKQGKQ